jgi:hypothetical protein
MDPIREELFTALKHARQYVLIAVFDGRDGKLGKTPESNANLLKIAQRDLDLIDEAIDHMEAS